MAKKNRDPEKKTKKHLMKERKKSVKIAAKVELSNQKQILSTSDKLKVNPSFPIAPTRCNQCGKGFISTGAATTHRGKKHPECCFLCSKSKKKPPKCGCVFSNKQQLRLHMDYHKSRLISENRDVVSSDDDEGSENADGEEEEEGEGDMMSESEQEDAEEVLEEEEEEEEEGDMMLEEVLEEEGEMILGSEEEEDAEEGEM